MQRTEPAPPRLPWPPLLLAAAILGGWLLDLAIPWRWPEALQPAVDGTGAVLIAAGVLLAVAAMREFFIGRTTVRPDRPPTSLVTRGYSRNPIYVADTIIILGLGAVSGRIWIALMSVPFVALVQWLAIHPEERLLEARFGTDFTAYKARVRRWI
jgi:protein-S-isoprenylcysteine O-methyltransferase Ste14